MGSAAQTCHLPTNKHSRTARAAIEQEHIFGTAKLTEVVATGFYCPGLVRAHNRGVPKIVDTVLQATGASRDQGSWLYDGEREVIDRARPRI